MGRKSLIFDSAWQDLHRRRARHRRIPAAVRSCSALRYGLLANFFFSPRNAPVFPGTTGLPAWTTPWAPFGRLQEPPPQKAETARTAGSCGRAGGTTTPALSPAILPRWVIPASGSPETGLPRRFWRAASSQANPVPSRGTQPLTAHHRSRSVHAVAGVSVPAAARYPAPCSPASAGSAGGPRPGVAAR